MRLIVLGSSGTFPALGNPASGYLASHGTQTVLIDLGPGVYQAMLGWVSVPDAIVLSHVHPDHCSDLFALLNSLRFGSGITRSVPLFAPPGLVDRFATFLGPGGDEAIRSVFTPTEVESGDVHVVGEFVLRFGAAVHPVPAVVTRIEVGATALVYSGDTGPAGDLEAMASGADLLVCEAALREPLGPDRYPFHLSAREAGAIATRAGVPRLALTHIPPTLLVEDSMAEAASEFDGDLMYAAPGMEVTV